MAGMTMRESLQFNNIHPNFAYGLLFQDSLPARNLRDWLKSKGYPAGVVFDCYLIFSVEDDRDHAMDMLQDHEGTILGGIGGIDSVDYIGQPIWSDYGSDSDYYKVNLG